MIHEKTSIKKSTSPIIKCFFSVFFTMYLVFIIFSCDAEAEKNKNADVIEVLENRDTTVIYAENIDNEHAILYRTIYPNVLFL
ncbi:MAG: hypothetical protein MJZ03_04835 [archaeon]|nr:hypothetical protein [archaeon]